MIRQGGRAPNAGEESDPLAGALADPEQRSFGQSLAALDPDPLDRLRVAVATPATNSYLGAVVGALARLDRLGEGAPAKFEHCRLDGTDRLDYFRRLAEIDTDWVVSLDEDALVLDPHELLTLIRFM